MVLLKNVRHVFLRDGRATLPGLMQNGGSVIHPDLLGSMVMDELRNSGMRDNADCRYDVEIGVTLTPVPKKDDSKS